MEQVTLNSTLVYRCRNCGASVEMPLSDTNLYEAENLMMRLVRMGDPLMYTTHPCAGEHDGEIGIAELVGVKTTSEPPQNNVIAADHK